MKTTVISNYKEFGTITHPIEADDLKTTKAYQYSARRAIVTDYTPEQRADLLEITHGQETEEGIIFPLQKSILDRLHIWQNNEAKKQRAELLGDGWQYCGNLGETAHAKVGDEICTIDGTRGRVTKSDPSICIIEFETANGQRLSVGGYFCKERKGMSVEIAYKVGDAITWEKYGEEHHGTVTDIDLFISTTDNGEHYQHAVFRTTESETGGRWYVNEEDVIY